MARRVLDDVLDSWEAEAPPDGFAAKVFDLAGERGNGTRNAELQSAHRSAESCLDAWEAEGPPQGFAEHVMGLAAERHAGLRAARPVPNAWKGDQPPQGFAERVVSLAERQQAARARTRAAWAAVAALAAVAAMVAGLLGNPLAMPWRHPGQLATSVPVPPQAPSEPAAAKQDAPGPRAVAPSMETVPRGSPTSTDTAHKTARRPLNQPRSAPRQAPIVARRAPEPQPTFVERQAPVPQRVANLPGSDAKEAPFDLAAYKRARTSALSREKRFNKTEGNGFGAEGSYKVALYAGGPGERGLQ